MAETAGAADADAVWDPPKKINSSKQFNPNDTTSHEFSSQMVVNSKGNPLISGKFGLVKCYNLARFNPIDICFSVIFQNLYKPYKSFDIYSVSTPHKYCLLNFTINSVNVLPIPLVLNPSHPIFPSLQIDLGLSSALQQQPSSGAD